MGGYKPQSRDTSEAIDRLQFELFRKMSLAERVAIFRGVNNAMHQLARIGINLRFPDATPEEVFLRLAATRLDRETMIRVYDWDPEAHSQ
ncbi:MAG: hypothetical protein NDJ92_12515 [Thermoanaerobaculia bacterium]|nr:hypothetical protein [Thermoanaerobaculia bacterium]